MDKIQPDQIKLDTNPMLFTTNVKFITGGNLLDKPTFGQVFMAGLKKFGAIFGRIGSSVLSAFPFFPGAQVASAGLYGLSNLAQSSYDKDLGKRMNNLAMDEAAAQANFTAVTPGFGMFGGPDAGQMAPTGPLGTERLDTVLNREAAAQSQIGMM